MEIFTTKNDNNINIAMVCASCQKKSKVSVDETGRLRECSIPIKGFKRHIVSPTDCCDQWKMSDDVAKYAINHGNLGKVKCKEYLKFAFEVLTNNAPLYKPLKKLTNEQLREHWEKEHKQSVYIDL